MKGLILTLALLGSAGLAHADLAYQETDSWNEVDLNAPMDPAADFVLQTMNRGKEIMELKSEADRFNQMCALMKQKVGKNHISAVWLGQYAQLAREAAAVNQFTNMIPSIIMSKAIDAIGGGTLSGSYVVNPKSVSRGNNVFAVKVQVTDAKGKSYNGTVVTHNTGGGWKIIDGEYMGFSAVNYQARDYQSFLNSEYRKNPNTSMPVTALIKQITSDPSYVVCN